MFVNLPTVNIPTKTKVQLRHLAYTEEQLAAVSLLYNESREDRYVYAKNSEQERQEAQELLKTLGLDRVSRSQLESRWNIQWSTSWNIQNGETPDFRKRILFQCTCGYHPTARQERESKKQAAATLKTWERRVPFDFTGCTAHVEITERTSDGEVTRIIGSFEHNAACQIATLSRLPAIPLHEHVYEVALEQLENGASISAIQKRNREMIQAKQYQGMEDVSPQSSNVRYFLLKSDNGTLYRKFSRLQGVDVRKDPQYNIDDWLDPQSPDFRPEIKKAIFYYAARSNAEERFKVCISTEEMQNAAWKYAHHSQLILDGTFGICTSRLLLFIALACDEHKKGVPVSFSTPIFLNFVFQPQNLPTTIMSHHRLTEHFRRGGWLPANREVLERWHKNKVEKIHKQRAALLPPIQELKDMIENDGDMYMGFNRMFENATLVKNYTELLDLMNDILTEAPFYGDLGPPFYMILAEPMNTNGGFTALLAQKLNAQFKKIFDFWAIFLESHESTNVLTNGPGGWFSSPAITAMEEGFDGLTFEQIFRSDSSKPHWGYTSWDDFFVRELNDGVRSLELPGEPTVINAACESVFYNKQANVQEKDQFWIKGEPYSLRHMLNHDPEYAGLFVGGSVLQGFLQVTGYHRWHSPVDGQIKKIVTVPGTYFVQSPALLGAPSSDNPYLHSLGFITAITTRMLIFIESPIQAIGLMCFIAIGMTEVSTCQATVSVGQVVKRGDELGMFHFGGSSHCLVFRKEANVAWEGSVTEPGDLLRVRAAIGVAQG